MEHEAAVIEAEQAVEKVRRAADLLSKVMDLSKRSRILGLWENCRRVREDLGEVVELLMSRCPSRADHVQEEVPGEPNAVEVKDNGTTLPF